jgi:hypothetical protein
LTHVDDLEVDHIERGLIPRPLWEFKGCPNCPGRRGSATLESPSEEKTMADETADPMDATADMPAQRSGETSPGSLDMSAFERMISAPAAPGPVVQWVVHHPDGGMQVMDNEDEALDVARTNGHCRLSRRVVAPWRR